MERRLDAENYSQNSEKCASQNSERNLNIMFMPFCEGVLAKIGRENGKV